MLKGYIFDIKRYAINDGPGIRTTVFFQGCNLECKWCHNPESQQFEECFIETEHKIGEFVFKEKKTVGKPIKTKELVDAIARDTVFHEESAGGVTFSGGEPLAQPEFLLEVLKECKKRGIHTCVDTSGSLKTSYLDEICNHTDLFLYDIKTADKEMFEKYVGNGFDIVFENLKRVAERGNLILIRIPIIPTINNSKLEIDKICDRLNILNINKIELMPYHRTGSEKYKRLGRKYEMGNQKSLTQENILPLKKHLRNKGFIIV